MAEHWQEYKETVLQRTAHLLESAILSDVEFLIGCEGNVKRIPAHKLILSMGSPVFAAMFQFPSDESKPIVVPDVTPIAFCKILQYLYTDYISIEKGVDECTLILELYYAANKYMIPKLIKECNKYFRSVELYPETICHILETATVVDNEILQDRCVNFISTHMTQVLKSETFLNSKQDTVQMIFEMEEVPVATEGEFFSALVAWGRAECRRKNIVENPANIRTLVQPLIPYVRFLVMSIEEFTKAINDAEDVLDCEETLAIYMKISKLNSFQNFKSLPSWCNTSGRRRLNKSDLLGKIPLSYFTSVILTIGTESEVH